MNPLSRDHLKDHYVNSIVGNEHKTLFVDVMTYSIKPRRCQIVASVYVDDQRFMQAFAVECETGDILLLSGIDQGGCTTPDGWTMQYAGTLFIQADRKSGRTVEECLHSVLTNLKNSLRIIK